VCERRYQRLCHNNQQCSADSWNLLWFDNCRTRHRGWPRDTLNLGTDRLVTINELFAIICGIAGKELRVRHDLSKPQGVRGRNSDNTRLRQVFGWEPSTPLEDGLRVTYHWIEEEMQRAGRIPALAGERA